MKWDDRNVRDSYKKNIRVGLHNVKVIICDTIKSFLGGYYDSDKYF